MLLSYQLTSKNLRERERDRHADRQTDTESDRQTDRKNYKISKFSNSYKIHRLDST